MEIIKQQEIYLITDEVSEIGWKMTGSANILTNKSMNVNFTVTKSGELTENIGSGTYFNDGETNMTNINYNVAESKRADFVKYIDTLVSQVKERFKE